MVAEVIDNTTSRGRTLRFLYDGPHEEFKEELFKLGETPLPTTSTASQQRTMPNATRPYSRSTKAQ